MSYFRVMLCDWHRDPIDARGSSQSFDSLLEALNWAYFEMRMDRSFEVAVILNTETGEKAVFEWYE